MLYVSRFNIILSSLNSIYTYRQATDISNVKDDIYPLLRQSLMHWEISWGCFWRTADFSF